MILLVVVVVGVGIGCVFLFIDVVTFVVVVVCDRHVQGCSTQEARDTYAPVASRDGHEQATEEMDSLRDGPYE